VSQNLSSLSAVAQTQARSSSRIQAIGIVIPARNHARDALGAFGQVLEISALRGIAHQVGAATVMEHFRDVPRHRLLLTSADATAELPRDWIDRQIKFSNSPVGLAAND
jgi:hypothetical protein